MLRAVWPPTSFVKRIKCLHFVHRSQLNKSILRTELESSNFLPTAAAKLMIDRVTFHTAAVEVYKFPTSENTLVNIMQRYDVHEHDKCKAARKAIVLAAAQIGRART